MQIVQFTFHYVSIKSQTQAETFTTTNAFTFHYVSIKSFAALAVSAIEADLHSTMYLLNLNLGLTGSGPNSIYIPLCIY